ncbi:MAG: LysM peptidoglycan-binding domain-containing protein [Desulfuromonadaceae bacterium]|nr:LysM peptidoglycan-binding domain-containing protein [Desulfuromonadaceae bacterium]
MLLMVLLTGCAGLPSASFFESSPPSDPGDVSVPQCVSVAVPDETVGEDPTVADTDLLTATLALPDDAGPTEAPAEAPLFDFPVVENARVRCLIDYYTGNGRRTFTRWLQRSSRYLPLMEEIFARQGLPRDMALLAMVESGFNSNAHSWANAVGHWQFIESTGKLYGLENSWWRDERRDVEKATAAAARYLKSLHDQFDGNWYLAVAAYNAGPGKVSRAVKRYGTTDFWALSRGDYLRAETKNYVPKLLAALLISKQPEKYGFCDLQYEPPLEFDTVLLPQATDLELVAKLVGCDYETLKQLNPELKRWCTPPQQKTYRLRVPAGSAEGFGEKYATVPPDERARYKRHQIRSGDTLGRLANQYGIRVDDIVALNRIQNPRALRVGQDLILPLQRDYSSRPIEELQDDYIRTARRHYTVRAGDSLWKIARHNGVTEKQLRVWNRLGWSDLLRPGQVLMVSLPTSQPRAVASAPVRKLVYQVCSGDTLWDISRRFSVKTGDIRQWNNLAENHVLHPGDKLTLMVPASRT